MKEPCDILEIPFEGGLLLYRIGQTRFFLLNETATLAWKAAGPAGSRCTAVEALTIRYGISRDRAERDVETLWRQWSQPGGLLDVKAPGVSTLRRAVVPTSDGLGVEKAYRLWGRDFRIRYPSSSEETRLHPRLAHLAVEPTGLAPLILWPSPEELGSADSDVEEPDGPGTRSIGLLFRRIAEAVFPDTAWIAQFHAAALSLEGRAVILAGRKGVGKSTLAAALLLRGFRYLSDDAVFLEAGGQVAGLPFRLALKKGSWPLLAPWFPELTEGPGREPEQIRVRHLDPEPFLGDAALCPAKFLVFPRFRAGSSARLEELRPSQALVRLIEQRAWFSFERDKVEAWANWVEKVQAFDLEFGNLEKGASLVPLLLR